MNVAQAAKGDPMLQARLKTKTATTANNDERSCYSSSASCNDRGCAAVVVASALVLVVAVAAAVVVDAVGGGGSSGVKTLNIDELEEYAACAFGLGTLKQSSLACTATGSCFGLRFSGMGQAENCFYFTS